jgi:sarcosine oxidase
MPVHFDVIIVGLGAMGSASAYQLARRGQRVLGLDRFAPPHTIGSSHGHTRIIREAYFEHPQYVPMVQRAYVSWMELEEETGRHLFEQTGGLMIGRPDGIVVSGARASADQHGLPYESLRAADLRERYPAFHPSDDMVALLEPRAGVLLPEECIEMHVRLAVAHGATLRGDEPVTSWRAAADGEGVMVETNAGRYTADRLVISAGAWLGTLVPDLRLPLTIERAVVHWFEPKVHADWFSAERLPIFIAEYAPGKMFYGFPSRPEGVKIALHHQGEKVDSVDDVQREVARGEIEEMRALIARYMPDLNGTWRASTVCLYTNTPDEDFIIDAHPTHPQVLLVSPCSGHGFKFSPVIGEIVANLIVDGRSTFDLAPFKLSRFLGRRHA